MEYDPTGGPGSTPLNGSPAFDDADVNGPAVNVPTVNVPDVNVPDVDGADFTDEFTGTGADTDTDTDTDEFVATDTDEFVATDTDEFVATDTDEFVLTNTDEFTLSDPGATDGADDVGSGGGETGSDGGGDIDVAVLDGIERELADVELALQRLGDGTYGRCESCGQVLGEDELESVPAGRFCRAHLPLVLP